MQAANDLSRLPTEIVVMNQQIAVLTRQIEGLSQGTIYSRMSQRVRPEHLAPNANYKVHSLESADQLRQSLERIRKDTRPLPFNHSEVFFRLHLFQLYKSPEEVFQPAVPLVIGYLEAPEAMVRRESTRLLHGLVLHRRIHMQQHIPVLTDALTRRLSDPDDRVRIEAAQVLESIGVEAGSAAARLNEIAADDDDEVAVFAALAIDAIDPQYHAVPRLQELVETRAANWEFAAEWLPEIMLPSDAEQYLETQLMQTKIPEEGYFFARILSQLKRRQMFPDEKEAP